MIFTLEAEVEPILVHRLTIFGRWELTVALLQEVVHRLIKHVDINKKHRIRRVFPFVLLDIVLVNLKCYDGRRTTDGRRTPSDGNTSHDSLGQVS
jgi:hypothetical protein